jgi:hypothetical protein
MAAGSCVHARESEGGRSRLLRWYAARARSVGSRHTRHTGLLVKGTFMGRLFGTDGVRGLANQDITAELALDLAVAAAHVLGDAGEFAGHRPRRSSGRDGRASGEFLSGGGHGRSGLRRRRRHGQRRRAAHPGDRLPHRRPGRRPRGHAVGLAQPHARQRDQVLRARRTQARRCRRGRHRGAAAASPGSARPAPTSAGPSLDRRQHPLCPPPAGDPAATGSTDCTSSSTRPRGRLHGVAEGFREAGADVTRSAPSPTAQHQRRLRLDPPGPVSAPSSRTAPSWDRPRRRRRPVPGRRRARRGRRRRPDHVHPRDGPARARRRWPRTPWWPP